MRFGFFLFVCFAIHHWIMYFKSSVSTQTHGHTSTLRSDGSIVFFFLQIILTSTYFGQPVGSAAAARIHLTGYLMGPRRDQYLSAIVQGFILQAQLIGFLPQNCPGHGKPDQSLWFDVTVDGKKCRWGLFQTNMLITPVRNHTEILSLKKSFQWNLFSWRSEVTSSWDSCMAYCMITLTKQQ